MKAHFVALLLGGLSFAANAQVISSFSWNSGLPTQADVGPDATSVSASAVVAPGGVGGTSGLKAGTPKADIDLTFSGTTVFDVPGMAVTFDYQREEADADALYRGTNFFIGAGNRFSVVFQISDGSGGVTRVSSPTFTIPNDDIFRTYGFNYDPSTGIANLTVDGGNVWTNDGPDNRNMVWTGLGDLVIGRLMDASGADKVTLDNLVISTFGTPALPVNLVDFTVRRAAQGSVVLQWSTSMESSNDFFELQRSVDAENWEDIARIPGRGTTAEPTDYRHVDRNPPAATVYYRLKQVDFDGTHAYSAIVSVGGGKASEMPWQLSPNPVARYLTVKGSDRTATDYVVVDSGGSDVTDRVVIQGGSDADRLDLGALPAGVYFIRSERGSARFVKL